MTVTVIGTGLIGGSLALDLKERGFADVVLGVDNNMLHADMALQLNLVDEIVKKLLELKSIPQLARDD